MKKLKVIFIILGIIIFLYLVTPVPFCKINQNTETPSESPITAQDILEIREEDKIILKVFGTSMYPTIQDNSQCLCVMKDSYNIGDIVSFPVLLDGELKNIVHRIIEKEGNVVTTQGDNNGFLDPKVLEENIICAVPKVARYKTFI